MRPIVFGVDPGINGAWAWYNGERLIVRDFPKIKSKGRGEELNFPLLIDELEMYCPSFTDAVIEDVGVKPQEGASTGFKFGYSAGALRMFAALNRAPIAMVSPTRWKGDFGLNQDKNYSRNRATQLFPNQAAEFKLVKDANKAEAALITVYHWRKLQGIPLR